MRTTINISDATLEELRRRAGEAQRPLRQVVEETLQRGLASNPKVGEAVSVRSYPVGIKAAYRGVSLNQLYDQIESEDHLKVAEE